MALKPHNCPRCHGDQHLSEERPPAWQCLQCGFRQVFFRGNGQPSAWERLVDELVESTQV
jgi:hypothetical protein